MFEPIKIETFLNLLKNSYNENILLKLKNLKKLTIDFSVSIPTDNPFLLWFLYKCYYKGHSVDIDCDKAFFYLEKAVNLEKNPIFLYDLGVLYEFGMGTPIDNDKAYECFLHAYNLNINQKSIYTGAIYYKMGFCSHKGLGIPIDIPTSIEYYKTAIIYNNYKAAYYLGLIYYNGTTIPIDYKESFKYFKICVESSKYTFSEGIYLLAKSYEYGLGCDIDNYKASELYCKGSKLNHLECIRDYAYLYISKKCILSKKT